MDGPPSKRTKVANNNAAKAAQNAARSARALDALRLLPQEPGWGSNLSPLGNLTRGTRANTIMQAALAPLKKGPEKRTTLMEAAHRGDVPRILELKRLGAAELVVDAKNIYGETALFYAIEANNPAAVGALLDPTPPRRVADVNVQSTIGDTPLILAVHKDSDVIVGQLLAAGANVNQDNDIGDTALIIASKRNNLPIARMLVAAGANVNVQRVDGTDPSLRRADGETPLYFASDKGHHEIVQLLIAAGANPNTPAFDGATPIYSASFEGHHRVVPLLLAAGADPNTIGNGSTALMVASENGHPNVVKILLEAGATVDEDGERGWTPLYVASQNGYAEVVRLLVAAGANPNLGIAARDDETPLEVARRLEQKEVVAILEKALSKAKPPTGGTRKQHKYKRKTTRRQPRHTKS